jgi:hypothetical protein
MSLIQVVLILLLVGVFVWAIRTKFPWLTPGWRDGICWAIGLITVLWLLQLFGVLPSLTAVHVGK